MHVPNPKGNIAGFLALAVASLFFSGCATLDADDTASRESPRILAMGDSMMAWHSFSKRAIPDAVAKELREPVANRSISGARMLYGLPVTGALGLKISKQYVKGDWDWVLVNGGGNDLQFGCGCNACDNNLDRMISEDGRHGAIPDLVADLRRTGARVIYVGYLRSPGLWSIIDHCRDEGDILEARLTRLDARDEGFDFMSLADLVPHGDASYHSADLVHPSLKASDEIGRNVAALIRVREVN